VIEDKQFAQQMEQMYLDDLANATEVVLDERSKPRAPGRPPHRRVRSIRGGGSAGRAAAGAVRIGNAIGAVFTNRRSLGPIEARIAFTTGALLCALAIVFALFPQVLAYPLVVIAAWGGIALVYRAYRLHRARRKEVAAAVQPASKT
jgi:cardiolipin synthase A/B